MICKTCDINEATHINEPDPYRLEIDGDDTPTDMCDECYSEALMEI